MGPIAINTITHVPTEEDVDFILSRLRECDRHEITSVGATLDHAKRLAMVADDCHVMKHNGEPVFVFGSRPTWPHVRGIFGFGTDKTWRVMPMVTTFINRVWKPRMFNELGATRIEVRLPISCTHSINWLSKLGMKADCAIDHYSITGERYLQLAYTKDDFANVH